MNETTEHYRRVVAFMAMAKQATPSAPTFLSPVVRLLRAKLMLEEVLETIEALGVNVMAGDAAVLQIPVEMKNLEFALADREMNLTKVVDGCADVAVVTTGTLVSIGVPDVEPQKIVDETNLRKFGEGHRLRDDGKLLPPPGFVRADAKLAEFLECLVKGRAG